MKVKYLLILVSRLFIHESYQNLQDSPTTFQSGIGAIAIGSENSQSKNSRSKTIDENDADQGGPAQMGWWQPGSFDNLDLIASKKHPYIGSSKARRIALLLKNDNGTISLSIQDDGVGIAQLTEHRKGRGLRIMRHRAKLMDTSFSVGPADGGGTLVSCSLAPAKS